MNTKSRPAKNNYVPGASRQPRSVATLRAQMEDLARGERIKARRQALRLTQPAVVDLLAKRAGAQVVTLRGYQTWEAGGGIRWDNAKVLAEVLDVDPEKLMVGGPYVDARETPDPFATADSDLFARLDQLEAKIDKASAERDDHVRELERLLNEQSQLLGTIQALIGTDGGTTLQDHLVQMLRDAAAQAGPRSGR